MDVSYPNGLVACFCGTRAGSKAKRPLSACSSQWVFFTISGAYTGQLLQADNGLLLRQCRRQHHLGCVYDSASLGDPRNGESSSHFCIYIFIGYFLQYCRFKMSATPSEQLFMVLFITEEISTTITNITNNRLVFPHFLSYQFRASNSDVSKALCIILTEHYYRVLWHYCIQGIVALLMALHTSEVCIR